MDEKTEKLLRKELKVHAKAIGIPEGAAKIFIDEVIKSINKTIKSKSVVTASDLKRLTVRFLKKYNKDLAYVYENRDTII